MIIKYITDKWLASIVVSSLLVSTGAYADSYTSIDFEVGRRSDDINFNIAGDINGNNPNILSELTWTGLRIRQAKVSVHHRSDKNSIVMISTSHGSIRSGSNQDSDYGGDYRTLEFSRSYNDTSGDDVVDREIGFGYQFDIYDSRSKNIAHLVPLVGYSYHEQNLRITNGNQVVQLFPTLVLQPFSGLNSTYQTVWDGKWIGLQLRFKSMVRQDRIYLFFKHHWPDYYAEGNWNLRTTFAHPKSFSHQASGTGDEFLIKWIENTTRVWALSMTVHFQQWNTAPGLDITYFSDGTAAATRLNGVEWQSTTFMLGVEVRI